MKVIQHPDGNQSVEASPEELGRMETLLKERADQMDGGARSQLLRLLGDAYYTAGELDRAAVWYAAFVQTNPPVAAGFIDRLEGLVATVAGNTLAPESLDALRAKTPSTEAPKDYEAGVEAAQAEDWPGAVTNFEQALAKDPEHFWAAHNLGVAYAQLGDNAHALMWFNRATHLDPSVASTHYNLGLLYLNEANPDPAALAFQKCKELDADYPEIYAVLGEALVAAEKVPAAREALEEAVRREEADAKTWLLLGRVAEAQNDIEQAFEAFHMAISRDPNLAEAHQMLAALKGRLA